MSTNDVPGVKDKTTGKSKNNDVLAMGCWAEHDDGSLVFVESVEGGRVIYSIFDLENPNDIIEYRDSMRVAAFKKNFSYNPKKKDSIKWTWHDKTPFPWDRVIDAGARAGTRHAHADDLLNAAEKVAKSRKLRKNKLDPDKYAHMLEQTGPTGRTIQAKLQKAIEAFFE